MMPLQRFLKAQEPVYAQVLAELHAGKKTSHWMWFIFGVISVSMQNRNPASKNSLATTT